MKLADSYCCTKCGNVTPLAEVLSPPKDGQLAQEKPCKCGATAWAPVRK